MIDYFCLKNWVYFCQALILQSETTKPKIQMTKQVFQKFIILVVLCLTSVTIGYSETGNQPNHQKTKDGIGRLDKLTTNPTRKRMPTHDFIDCHYENGLLTLTSEMNISQLSLEIVAIESFQSYTIPTISIDEPFEIDLDYGDYEVIASLENNTTYRGMIFIQ